MLGHQLAAQRERILPGRVRDLVDEALEVDRVVVEVHAAPEAGRHVRVAHRVVDQQVRDRVAERAFGAAGVEALEATGSLPSCRFCGKQRRRRSTGPRCACAAPVTLPCRIEARAQLALRDRVVDGRASCPLRATRSA